MLRVSWLASMNFSVKRWRRGEPSAASRQIRAQERLRSASPQRRARSQARSSRSRTRTRPRTPESSTRTMSVAHRSHVQRRRPPLRRRPHAHRRLTSPTSSPPPAGFATSPSTRFLNTDVPLCASKEAGARNMDASRRPVVFAGCGNKPARRSTNCSSSVRAAISRGRGLQHQPEGQPRRPASVVAAESSGEASESAPRAASQPRRRSAPASPRALAQRSSLRVASPRAPSRRSHYADCTRRGEDLRDEPRLRCDRRCSSRNDPGLSERARAKSSPLGACRAAPDRASDFHRRTHPFSVSLRRGSTDARREVAGRASTQP